MEKNDLWKYPVIIDYYLDLDYIYFSNFHYNSFFRINRNNYNIENLGVFKGFCYEESWQGRSIYEFDGRLYIFSFKSYEVVSYDLEGREMKYFHPEENNVLFDSVRCTCRVGNDIWIFREYANDMVAVFSMDKNSYSFYKIPIKEDVLEELSGAIHIYLQNAYLIDGIIWRCVCSTNILIGYDVSSKQIEIKKLNDVNSLLGMRTYMDNIYFTQADSLDILCYDKKFNLSNIYMNQNLLRKEYSFWDVVFVKGKMYSLPCFENYIVCYDVDVSNLSERLELPQEFMQIFDLNERNLFHQYYCDEAKILLFPFGGNALLEIDILTNVIKYIPLEIRKEDYIKNIAQAEINNLLKIIDTKISVNEKVFDNKYGKSIWNGVK